MTKEVIGKWAFIIGLVIAILAGFIQGYATTVLPILFILGLVVGFLNIEEKNLLKFLVASIALITLGIGSISVLAILGDVSQYISLMLGNFIAFVCASALVVSIKAIVETGNK